MKHISFCLKPSFHPTEVYVGDGILEGAISSFLSSFQAKKVIVADRAVFSSAKALGAILNADLITMQGGETEKTYAALQLLLDALFEKNCDKETILIAMGGGVITDLSGFAASIYKRGIPLVFIPTTVMGAVDASIGGKTGINCPFGKNLIGTIYPAKAVFTDFQMFQTLPEKEWFNGFAEILKLGLVFDADLWNLARKGSKNLEMIVQAIQGKIDVVKQDRSDLCLRNILNFGHTIGHALEKVSEYEMSHGEAVALGCIVESHLSFRLGILQERDFEEILSLYKTFALSLPKKYSRDVFIKAMHQDKKVKSGNLRFVLIETIGRAAPCNGQYCQSVDLETLIPTLEWMEVFYEAVSFQKSDSSKDLSSRL